MAGRPYTVVALPDIHLPEIHESLSAVMTYLVNNPVDEVVLLGDFIDFPSLSHWLQRKLLQREGKRLSQEYEEARKILNVLNGCANKITYLYGNHEAWVEQYIDEHPELSGMVDIDIQLKLRDRNIDWYAYGLAYSVGHVRFTHGFYINLYHARKHSEEIGACYYGHTHDIQIYIKKRHFDEPEEAHSIGCLCGKNPSYLSNKPNRWKNGFGLFYIGDDGQYTRYIPVIVDGKFYGPDGTLYRGK